MNHVWLGILTNSIQPVDATHFSVNYAGILVNGGGSSSVGGTITFHVDSDGEAINQAVAADARAYCLNSLSTVIDTNELTILNPCVPQRF
jgi:hypothetical protein